MWPRAADWFAPGEPGEARPVDAALLGVPAHRSSITPSDAHETPAAVREALRRYSTWAGPGDAQIGDLRAVDLGDVEDPDGPVGEARVAAAVAGSPAGAFLVALGGDNSITWSVMRGLAGDGLPDWGLVTVDAHHDLRDGESNGSPVRRLVGAGLSGENAVQIGIGAFSNSPPYSRRARELGITVVSREEMRGEDLDALARRALDVAGAGGRPVYVDLDVDVCDLAEVPGCPSAAPGGISADDLRRLARAFASDPRVKALDITEIDATRDSADQRTVKLAALLVLEAAAGVLQRKEHP